MLMWVVILLFDSSMGIVLTMTKTMLLFPTPPQCFHKSTASAIQQMIHKFFSTQLAQNTSAS